MANINPLTNNTEAEKTLDARMRFTLQAVVVPYFNFIFVIDDTSDYAMTTAEELGDYIDNYGLYVPTNVSTQSNFFARDLFTVFPAQINISRKQIVENARIADDEIISELAEEIATLKARLNEYETPRGTVRKKYRQIA